MFVSHIDLHYEKGDPADFRVELRDYCLDDPEHMLTINHGIGAGVTMHRVTAEQCLQLADAIRAAALQHLDTPDAAPTVAHREQDLTNLCDMTPEPF